MTSDKLCRSLNNTWHLGTRAAYSARAVYRFSARKEKPELMEIEECEN